MNRGKPRNIFLVVAPRELQLIDVVTETLVQSVPITHLVRTTFYDFGLIESLWGQSTPQWTLDWGGRTEHLDAILYRPMYADVCCIADIIASHAPI